ncbi:acyl-CoA dehydrogenase family protein [Streptomyces sp. NPDC050418]|uniref:acyl-CoA dehydrogenase family protein n=1 Tax=Streptomyces sp. NPDC050418 TaxID=3365612 RepID=UPI00379718E0
MALATAPSHLAPVSGLTGPGPAHWLRVAREAAEDLATDAVAREQAGKAPLAEVAQLREAGLLGLLSPGGTEGGGSPGDTDWSTACAVVREIAAADGAIGQLLGHHYFLAWSGPFLRRLSRGTQASKPSATAGRLWGGGLARQEPPLRLARTSRGLVLDGRQSYTTGVLVADRLAVRAVRQDTGEPFAVAVDPTGRGVRIDDAADAFGRRLAAGADVEFDGAPVAADDVIGSLSSDEDCPSPRAALLSPVGRLVFVQLLLGTAEGVLAETREYSRTGHAPRYPAGAPRDPQALTVYGELTVLTRAASALTEQALAAVQGALALGEQLTYDTCAEASALVAMAEAAAATAAQESATRALGIIGPRAASSRLGFDRFWRNVRTHTLYEPVTHRLRDVGDYYLNGSHPPFTLPA